jgi:hypothetical protein
MYFYRKWGKFSYVDEMKNTITEELNNSQLIVLFVYSFNESAHNNPIVACTLKVRHFAV